MKEDKPIKSVKNISLNTIATGVITAIAALNFACSSQNVDSTQMARPVYPTISCPYPLDLDRDGCADRIIVGNEGIYVQMHNIFEYGMSNGFSQPQLVVPINSNFIGSLTDIIVTHANQDGVLDLVFFLNEKDCASGSGFRGYIALGRGDGTFQRPERYRCNVNRDFSAPVYVPVKRNSLFKSIW